MKVALIIDTWFPIIGGGQINAYEISRRLAQKKIIIDIITRNTGQDNLKLPKNLRIIKLGSQTADTNVPSRIAFLIRSFFYVSRNKYDLVHAHAFLPGITARLLNILQGLPSVFTIHGTSLNTNLNNFFKKKLEKFILTGVSYNAQITVSRDFLKLKNVNQNIIYVPNGIETKNFDKITARKAKDPTLIFVGRLHPQKNLQNLLKAVLIVKKDIPDIYLIIVGEGEQKKLLKNQVAKMRLEKRVVFKGEVLGSDLVKLYKSSRLFVLPSIYEGQPLALFEAWAAKLPVVVSKTGDTPNLVKDGLNGYLIPDQLNHLSIAATILKALKNPRLRRLGQNGYNFVNENFSWDKSAASTLKIYKKVLTQ